MEEDLERRFGIRFKQDVPLFASPYNHAMLIERINFAQVDIEFEKRSEESQTLYESFLEARQKEKELSFSSEQNSKQYKKAKSKRKKLQRLIQKKRSEWLDDIQGHPAQVRLLVRKHLLDLEPESFTKTSCCTVCFEELEDGSFGFVCDKDHVMHFGCAVELVTNALLDHRSPLESLACPFRCGCFFVFKGKTKPLSELRTFRRVFVKRSSKKRKRETVVIDLTRPLKR